MGNAYETTHQYEPLRVPEGWDDTERRLIVQLTELFDDLYRRFNRLRFEDFAGSFQKRVEDTEGNAFEAKQTAEGLTLQVNDLEGGITTLQLTTEGMAAAVQNNRLRFSASGLEIINAQGATVFRQDNDTGNLTITGHIQASSGAIGGFSIMPEALSNGANIELNSRGFVRLGKLTITDDANYGPILRGDGGLCVMVDGSLYGVFADGKLTTQVPLDAKFGLLANPQVTTSLPPNVYMDPQTGKIMRSTYAGGTGGTGGTGGDGGSGANPGGGSGTALYAALSVDQTTVSIGSVVRVSCNASGGTAPYTYTVNVSHNGGSSVHVSGSGSTRNYTVSTAGTYDFSVMVRDSAGATYEAFSQTVSCEKTQSALSVYTAVNTTTVAPGALVTFTIYASGGSGSYRYYSELGKDGVLIGRHDGKTVVAFTPTQPGYYQLGTNVYDNETNDRAEAMSPIVTVQSANSYVSTTGSNVNVRSGPGTSHAVIGNIGARGTQVQITGGPEGGFYQIWWSAGGLSGWVSSDYLSI